MSLALVARALGIQQECAVHNGHNKNEEELASVPRIEKGPLAANVVPANHEPRLSIRDFVAMAEIAVGTVVILVVAHMVGLLNGSEIAFDDIVYGCTVMSVGTLIYLYRSDWRRRDVFDALVVTALALLVYSLAHFLRPAAESVPVRDRQCGVRSRRRDFRAVHHEHSARRLRVPPLAGSAWRSQSAPQRGRCRAAPRPP